MAPMLAKLLPTEVPPYFWMTQGTLSSDELDSRGSGDGAVGVEPSEPVENGMVTIRDVCLTYSTKEEKVQCV
jgi:hypothetical protein